MSASSMLLHGLLLLLLLGLQPSHVVPFHHGGLSVSRRASINASTTRQRAMQTNGATADEDDGDRDDGGNNGIDDPAPPPIGKPKKRRRPRAAPQEPQPEPSLSKQEMLEMTIDSFLDGDYDRPFAEDAAAPLPQLRPKDTVKQALYALRDLDHPEPAHGAAVFQRFCLPLSRSERWGLGQTSDDAWRNSILRASLTPAMLAGRILASGDFSGLLAWSKLDVTQGTTTSFRRGLPVVDNVAFVNVALWFDGGLEPTLLQFTLRKVGGVWLIHTARKSDAGLFMD